MPKLYVEEVRFHNGGLRLAVDLVKVHSDGGRAIRYPESGSVQAEFLEGLVEFIGGATGSQGARG